jgi:hypothetical protein
MQIRQVIKTADSAFSAGDSAAQVLIGFKPEKSRSGENRKYNNKGCQPETERQVYRRNTTPIK